MLRLELKLFGSVQQREFRYSIAHYIKENFPQIVGSISSCPDGSIDIICYGGIEEFKHIRRYCLSETQGACVRDCHQQITSCHPDDIKLEDFIVSE